jgi:hypothetical protein
MLSLIEAQVRAVLKVMAQQHPNTTTFGDFYVGRGDRFDDDRRRVHQENGVTHGKRRVP